MANGAQTLTSLLEEIAKEQNYTNGHIEVKAISSGGANYTSALFEATLTTPRKEALKLFVKVANIGRALRDGDELFDRVFHTERIFYTKLAVAFEQLYNKHSVAEEYRIDIPKHYGSKSDRPEEILVLENLAIQGFENFDRTKTVDWVYASKSVEELAKFHALGLVYRIEHREELNEMAKTVFCNMWSHEEMKNTFLNQAIKMGTQVIKKEYRPKIQEFLNKFNLLDGIEKLWKPSENGFLIHSDYRPSNLLHRRQNGKMEMVIVDYQLLHLGTLAADLMFFIWSSSDSQFRQQHYHQLTDQFPKNPNMEEIWINATKRSDDWFPSPSSVVCSRHFKSEYFKLTKGDRRILYTNSVPTLHCTCQQWFTGLCINYLLEHYYNELKHALQNLHYDINEVYPRSTFDQELEDTKIIGLFVGLAIMNLLTVNPEDAPQLDSFENMAIKPNERAIERMNGVVEDCIRWGII